MTRISGVNPLKWLDKAFQKDPEKALAYTTVASIVIKDGVGCYKYVTQSLNNKEIPKERRNFVAALDLTNGVLMILAQLGMFALMRKYSEPLFNKIFDSSFGKKAQTYVGEQVRMLAKKSDTIKTIYRKIEIAKSAKDIRKDALEAFKYIAELSAATIVGKRIVVPFIATPLANIVKGKMEEKDAEKEAKEVKDCDCAKEVEDDD